jgi:sec-independent protein translocase protein TatA
MDLLSPVHLVIILAVALLIFGPKRLPEIGSGLGKTIREFRKSMNDIQQDAGLDQKASAQEPGTTKQD